VTPRPAALAAGGLATVADVGVSRRGAMVERDRVGDADRPFLLFSISKLLTAVVVLSLVDADAIDLDAPVARYVPEFAQHGKGQVTVDDVLTHRGGFSELATGATVPLDAFADPAEARATLCALPFDAATHGVAVYHPVSFSILADVVEAATGMRFDDVSRRLVLEPLGMRSTTWGSPSGGAVPLVGPGVAEWWVDGVRDGVVAAINAFSTVDDVVRLLEMLADAGGTVLTEGTVAGMLRPHAAARGQAGAVAFGRGVFLGSEPGTLSGRGATASPVCWGHAGHTATQAWHDPECDLTVVALTNGCVEQGSSDLRFHKLADALRAPYL
jgi:CubicO group peptidase (beta-lactamase class C family)